MTTGTATALAQPSLSHASDLELVQSTLGGHENCFEELVRRYQRPIAAYVFRLVGDYDSALDLTQEVFIRVYASLQRYRSDFKFSTWIYRIAHNAAIDSLRRNTVRGYQRATSIDEPFIEPMVQSGGLNPEENSVRRELRFEVEMVVQMLAPIYRELVILRHGDDLSYEEIASVTGLPLGTVKNRLFRAREMLRTLLLSRGIDGL